MPGRAPRAPLQRLAFAALALATLGLAPPRYTREQMESALGEDPRWRFVYGTADPGQAAALRERARAVARRLFGGDSTRAVADRDVSEEALAGGSFVLFGGPDQNTWTRRLASALPVRFAPGAFRWADRDYDRPGDVLHLVYPSPLDPRRFLLLVAGNSAAAVAREGGGFFFGGEDWRIYRDGELTRAGEFAQSAAHPWRYDPALDRDREEETRRFVAQLVRAATPRVAVLAPPDLANAPLAGATLERADTLLARLDALGLAQTKRPRPGRAAALPEPIPLTLYRSLEEKGRIARDTRPEHVEAGAAHAALPAGRTQLDLGSVAAARLVRLGAAERSPWLEPAGAALTGRFGGEPLARAVGRVYFGRVLPSAREAAGRGEGWRSPLLLVPARALLVLAVRAEAGPRANPALLALLNESPPGTLDSLCARAGVAGARVEQRYRLLADSLGRAGQRDRGPGPRPWQPADGFQRGVCLAHAVSLERGYLSADCARELATLRQMGVGWISLSPFGWLPSTGTPTIVPSAEGGAEEESDEALCEAGARARALGLRVWLAPQLWTRGWVGDLSFGPAGWARFFQEYRSFLLHYALLAEREGFDGLVVGHELASASLGFPDRWRAMIAEVRRVYRGTLTYDANWDREVRGLAFWDALDLVGVSFYAPLASKPGAKPAELEAGAAKALAGLKGVAARARRPVLLSELGYAPCPDAPLRPWEERRGAPDLETQRACYEAVVDALAPCDWVAGVFFWKWFSTDRIGGPGDPTFTPRGKPAEAVLRRALREWQGRPVRVPGAPTR